jgi:hypothetical protein
MRASLLDRAYRSIRSELDRTHEVITTTLRNADAELQQIDRYIYSVPGKMLRSRAAGLPQNEYCDGLRTLVDYLLRMALGVTDRRTTESSRSRTVDPGRPADGVRHGR